MAVSIEIPTTFGEAKEKVVKLGESLSRARDNLARKDEALTVAETQLQRAQGMISQMLASAPKVMQPGVEFGLTVGAAGGGAYLQELLNEKQSGKIGPFEAVPVLSLAGGVGALLWIDNPDVQRGVLALAEGGAAVGAVHYAEKVRKAHKEAMDKVEAEKAAAKAADKKAA